MSDKAEVDSRSSVSSNVDIAKDTGFKFQIIQTIVSAAFLLL